VFKVIQGFYKGGHLRFLVAHLFDPAPAVPQALCHRIEEPLPTELAGNTKSDWLGRLILT
jgi:hypothetical protein